MVINNLYKVFNSFIFNPDRWITMENISAGKFNYFDDQNFRYGFRRSGYFTVREAEYLESHGQTLKELEIGVRTPESDDETHFQLAIRDNLESNSFAVKAWRKYKNAISAKSQRIFLSQHCGASIFQIQE